ncbi:MAG: hypothetical protein A2075_10325 [Geobacteraceae bacterium GWC2_58_44]|nr:MAG: hypothetical protein A2075_10325 [Geobacteraceae bacterium GWC2_58_44]HBG04544.1 hypothetical protein [Geobacter sp.]
MKKLVVMAVMMFSFIVLLTGCTGTVNTVITPNADLKQYKTAYVEMLQQDEFNLGAAIMAHMMSMGFVVKHAPLPNDVLTTDLLVKYSYYDGWDMVKYMKNFSVNFSDAKTNAVLLNSRYNLPGATRGETFRINYTFNDIRIKAGYPPLEGF